MAPAFQQSHAKPQRREGPQLCFAFLLLCGSLFFLPPRLFAAAVDPDAAATVVVFNERDPASIALAGYYADKRGIPYDHLIGLSCTLEDTVPRADYDKTIARPLRRQFLKHGWWKAELDLENGRIAESKIRFVALMRGIPLKIGSVSTYEGDQPLVKTPLFNHNEAAVDSELAVLGMATRQISGPVDNPLFGNVDRLKEPSPWLLMVCRLDAAQPPTVRRMIDDSLATEKTGLWGFAYVDSRGLYGSGMAEGDNWLRRIVSATLAQGIPCIQDVAPTLFPEHYPLTRAALYFGWYSGQISGVFQDQTFRFVPGAVAVHIHSYSADSLREPLRGWCAPMLEKGAAATLGNVYEPYLTMTSHLGIFEERLREGWTFAEAAYAAQPALSWMATFIGDPLYRPFKAQQDIAVKPPAEAAEYAAYRDGAVRWASEGRLAGEPVLRTSGLALKSGVIFEALGLLQLGDKDSAAALVSWAQAGEFYKTDADRIRCGLHAIGVMREEKKTAQALALTRKQIQQFPNAEATARLRAIELELAPPPSPSPVKPSTGIRQ